MSCTGACCAAFPISKPLDQIGPETMDGLDLLAMLVPISVDEARERRERFGAGHPVEPDSTYYRCAHWDEETRLCTNYDNRPAMCRWYPYGQPCEHGCDCVAARPIASLERCAPSLTTS